MRFVVGNPHRPQTVGSVTIRFIVVAFSVFFDVARIIFKHTRPRILSFPALRYSGGTL